MDWTNVIITACTIIGTFITLGSLLNKKFNSLEAKFNDRFDKIDARFDKIDARLDSIDHRLSRLEGSFEERGHWEGRFFNMHKEMKEE